MGYLLAINTSRRNKLPKDATPAEWARFNDAFRNVELTPGEIASCIRAGYAIAPQCDGRRKRDNWRLAQHIGIDLDNGLIAWDDLVHMPLVDQHASMVHTTASHTPEHPRYRVLFLLSEPMRDPDAYTYAVRCFLKAFGTADEHCKDPARLFFGAAGCSLVLMPDNVITPDDLAYIMATWPADDARAGAENVSNWTQNNPPAAPFYSVNSSNSAIAQWPADDAGGIVSPSDVSPARKDAHLEALLSKIRYCPDGEKWATLRDVSITLGGYAAAGYFDVNNIRGLLRQAIEARRATVASMPAAYDTIDSGLAYGAMRPLYYEASARPAHHTPPPADARHRLRWIMERRIAELEDAILAADMETCPDFESMAREYSILQERLAA